MSDPVAWTRAHARQARADFETCEKLRRINDIPSCRPLLFLQMACEKPCKAHLCASGSIPRDLQSSYAYIERSLPIIIRERIDRLRPGNGAWVFQHSKDLAREIELLAPAVRRGGRRPDNCEYPWEDEGGTVHVPLDWSSSPAKLLTAPAGRTFLKLVDAAISRLV